LPAKFVIKKGPYRQVSLQPAGQQRPGRGHQRGYSSRAPAIGGVRSVKKIAAEAEVEDQTTKEWAAVEATRKAAAATQKAASSAKRSSPRRCPRRSRRAERR
jgi:hypothetical protein